MWRFEKEPTGDYAIVIDGWENGVAPDPYSGIQRMTQVNLSVPGEVSVGYTPTISTISSGTLGVPIARTTAFSSGVPTAHFILTYASGAESLVFASSNGAAAATWSQLSTNNTNTSGLTNNQGLAYWKGYLFKFRANKIDYLANGAGDWTTGTGWQTISDTGHFALVGTDDVLYFCNGNYVGSIIEVAGSTFDPANAATYTFNASALKLPSNDFAVSLATYPQGLLVGGSFNVIYPWDTISPDFGDLIYIGDNYINRMVTVNTNVFIFPGQASSGTLGAGTGRGRIFITNGSQADEYFKVPDYISGVSTPYFGFGDAIFHRNNLLFTMKVTDNATGAIIALPSLQIWALDLTTKAFRSITTASSTYPFVLLAGGSGHTSGFNYIFAETNATNGIIEYSGSTAGIGSYSVRSDLIPVGTFLQKKTFSQVEFKLRTPLASGESLVLTASTDDDSQNVGTANTVGQISGVFPVNFQGSQWLYITAVATGNSATGGVPLTELRIR